MTMPPDGREERKPVAVLYSLDKKSGKVVAEKFYGENGIIEADQTRDTIGDDFDCVALGTDKKNKKARKAYGDYRMKKFGLA